MLIIKRNIEKVWGARYTLGAWYLYIIRDAEKVCGARYLPKNTVFNRLLVPVKQLSHDTKQFEMVLKGFLYLYSFYLLDECFKCNTY
jgi:hypothetical protein